MQKFTFLGREISKANHIKAFYSDTLRKLNFGDWIEELSRIRHLLFQTVPSNEINTFVVPCVNSSLVQLQKEMIMMTNS